MFSLGVIHIQGPEVLIENPDMNLGLIQLGDIGKGTLTLRNMSQVTAQWNLRDLKSQPDDDGVRSVNQHPTYISCLIYCIGYVKYEM